MAKSRHRGAKPSRRCEHLVKASVRSGKEVDGIWARLKADKIDEEETKRSSILVITMFKMSLSGMDDFSSPCLQKII